MEVQTFTFRIGCRGELLIGNGAGQPAETLGLPSAEYADDLAFLGPRDLIEHGVEQHVVEDLFQRAEDLYGVTSRPEVQGIQRERE